MPQWMTLFEYLLTLLDPVEAEEFRRLARKRFAFGSIFAGAPGIKFADAERRLKPVVLKQLRRGSLIAEGYLLGAPLQEPPSRIHTERWDAAWKLDFERSSAAASGEKIIRIRVCRAKDLAAEQATQAPPATAQPRMVIRRGAQLVVIDGAVKRIPMQPFKMLLMLADAAIGEDQFVPAARIEKELGRQPWNLAYDLKKALAGKQAKHKHFKALVENRKSPSAYRLALAPGQLQTLP